MNARREPSQLLAALGCGALFGFGLALSGMIDPARVRGFLDIFGRFDPSLAFVLAGAVAISFVGVRLSHRLRHPLLDDSFHLPTGRTIDAKLIGGAALFGIGWGMAGLCPGPAIAALALGKGGVFVFALAMAAGILIHDRWLGGTAAKPVAAPGRAVTAESADA
ncbi:protein of unknown function DUF395 YeeE/YedE [Methylocella silvestris BL2]|uniref:YeeE/YedE family protein n=1 Tax=Methylocella silvestris (strain DSM 15510 / CIP 108128 / LMG 27833 / NCIMB 13906 / BL2) TaxID=395965 RepID=B8ENS4_METSB|nr:YeeE/YedE family protein [Methylocella silvestris]ACK50860.1 protein of unknown function DUF395 YeeE/YedE [Methylocella silvestris BL2]